MTDACKAMDSIIGRHYYCYSLGNTPEVIGVDRPATEVDNPQVLELVVIQVGQKLSVKGVGVGTEDCRLDRLETRVWHMLRPSRWPKYKVGDVW